MLLQLTVYRRSHQSTVGAQCYNRIIPELSVFMTDGRCSVYMIVRESARMSKFTNDGLTPSHTTCFIAIHWHHPWTSSTASVYHLVMTITTARQSCIDCSRCSQYQVAQAHSRIAPPPQEQCPLVIGHRHALHASVVMLHAATDAES